MPGSNSKSNNKRIAKNTLLLYIRMIVTTIVSLYTVRLVLRLLGVEDYGIFNVIAGLMGFMAVITATMTSATQRFLAYDLGKGDIQHYKYTFSMFIDIFAIFCVLAVVLMEFIGPYCIYHYLVIPANKLYASQWIFQFTIVNFVLTTMTIPHISSIVAYEKMNVYAHITFIDVFFKLLAVVALYYTPIDKLITYGLVMMLFQVATAGIIILYSHRNLEGCRYHHRWDQTMFKHLSSYAGWNLLGSLSGILMTYGQSIILNIFFGPIINAAKAIADKINAIVVSFSSNFYMAVTPQIIKSYAAEDIDYTRSLVLNTSRYSFMLLSALSFPLIFNMRDLLYLWLGEDVVSNEMVIFSQLQLLCSLILIFETPITMAIRATGNIKKYQIYVSIQTLLFIPICYLAFLLGMQAHYSMLIMIIIMFIAQFTRVYLVSPVIHTTIKAYIYSVLVPSFAVAILVAVLHYASSLFFSFPDNLLGLILRLCFSFIVTAIVICFIGVDRKERSMSYIYLKKKFCNKKITAI